MLNCSMMWAKRAKTVFSGTGASFGGIAQAVFSSFVRGGGGGGGAITRENNLSFEVNLISGSEIIINFGQDI